MNRDNYVTILAIYDDPPTPAAIPSSASSPTIISVEKTSRKENINADGVVEITNLTETPSLKVISDGGNYSARNSPFLHHQSEQSSSPAGLWRSPASDGSQKAFQHHHSSSGSSKHKETNMDHLSRSHARKSRFTEAFLDARDRLEEQKEMNEPFPNITDPHLKQLKIHLAAETANIPLGIEISAVPDPNDHRRTRILAVEVRSIDEDGRIAIDGRLRVGDQITDINHRPVYQMSFPAAQARLHELQSVEEPILIATRRIDDEVTDLVLKPLKTTALQQANTTKTGNLMSIIIQKSSAGVRGPAYNKLQIGDRLLKINDTDVITFSQAQVVAMLKKAPINSDVTFEISRLVNENDHTDMDSEKPTTSSLTKSPESLEFCHKRRQSAFVDTADENVEFITFDVQLINSRSAGLGISLKGGKLYSGNGTLESGSDCGLFVKGILHGSAAFHDGRFQQNDRLIGIEDLDLREYKQNASALAAFTVKLGEIPLSQKSVKIHIARCKDQSNVDFGRKTSSNREVPSQPKSSQIDGYDSEVSLAPDFDEFNRKNPKRKSISEKRPFGAGNDASQTQIYQKIMHQRQTSAPKPRSLSHEPFSSKEFNKIKEDAMIHEVIAGTKAGTLQSSVLRRKKVEPAPSFKMAMSNSQPSFDSVTVDQRAQAFNELQTQIAKDKNKRKSTAGGFLRFLQRGGDISPKHGDHEKYNYESAPRMPPPYNASHRQIPPPLPPHGSHRYPRTVAGPISHHRIHSAQETSSSTFEPETILHYQQHCYDGPDSSGKAVTEFEQAPPHIVHYSNNLGNRASNAYHIFHPTTAYVSPSPHQQHQLSIHQRQLLQQQQRERASQAFQPSAHRRNGDYGTSMGSGQVNGLNNNCDYYDAFNAWFTQTARPLGGRYIPQHQPSPMASEFNNYEAAAIPPPIMPRNCNAPVIPLRTSIRHSKQPAQSVPLHRVPSPSSPLHILTPTTPPDTTNTYRF